MNNVVMEKAFLLTSGMRIADIFITSRIFEFFYCRTKRSENLRFSEEKGLMSI